ncbi:D-glycero-alpha-D-manno-heptose-1,7-bisphosphate 7-phosphatase [Bacteroidota bacterium]
MNNHALFLDRDGTLNFDPGYLGNPELVKLFPGVSQSLAKLKNKYNFKLIVISNQSGITRGLISEKDVIAVNDRINKILEVDNVSIDAFYFCPFHPEFDPVEKCECRKPSPKMVFEAVEDFSIDLSRSYFLGDSACDVLCGINAGIKTVLIKNTISEFEINNLHNGGNSPNFVAGNFNEACDFIIKDFEGEN